MKNKIFKALGVGALATLGLFTFTGCSLIGGDNADVVNGLKNNNSNLEKVIDLLKDQNKKLNEQNSALREENDILQDYLEEIQNENAKITEEEAWNKLLNAKVKFETNYQGIRDNLRVTGVLSNNELYTSNIQIDSYKSENNGFVTIEKLLNSYATEEYSSENLLVYYEEDGEVCKYDEDVKDNTYTKEIDQRAESSEMFSISVIAERLNFLFSINSENSKIINVEIMENGNYKISIACEVVMGDKTSDESTDYYKYKKSLAIMNCELTKEDMFISMDLALSLEEDMYYEDVDYHRITTTSGSIRFEYNVIAEDYINGLLEKTISKDLRS